MPGRDGARQPASGPVPGAGRARPGEGPLPLCRRCPKHCIQAVSPQAQPPRSPPPPPAQRASVLCRSLETGGGDVGAGHTGRRATALAPLRARFRARAGPRGPGVLTLGVAGRGAELRHSRTARSEGPRPPRASTLRRRWGGRLSPA